MHLRKKKNAELIRRRMRNVGRYLRKRGEYELGEGTIQSEGGIAESKRLDREKRFLQRVFLTFTFLAFLVLFGLFNLFGEIAFAVTMQLRLVAIHAKLSCDLFLVRFKPGIGKHAVKISRQETNNEQIREALMQHFRKNTYGFVSISNLIKIINERGWPEDWYFILNRYGGEGVKEAIKNVPYFNDKDMTSVSHQLGIPFSELKCYEKRRSTVRTALALQMGHRLRIDQAKV